MNRQAFFLATFCVSTLLGSSLAGEEKVPKKKEPPFQSMAIELTETAPADWLLKEAKVGAKIWSDRDYLIAALPDELKGATLVWRPYPDMRAEWLSPSVVSAKRDGAAYVAARGKYLGKEMLDEVTRAKLKKEGWTEIEEAFESTFPNGENWEWTVYKKPVKKGDVILQLKTISWRTTSVFFFK